MTDTQGLSLATLLWCLPAFLILIQKPASPRSALSSRALVFQGMIPIATSVITLALASLLLWILLYRLPPPPGPGFFPWLSGTGVLIGLTALGIGLLPLAFPSTCITKSITWEGGARFMAGMAWASCWPLTWELAGNGNPTLLLLGAVCGLLPDTIDQWLARHLHRIDVHIVPDPLAPSPDLVAAALAQAITRCQANRRVEYLQLYPGQDQQGNWQECLVTLDSRNAKIRVSLAGLSAAIPVAAKVTSSTTYTFPVGESALSLAVIPLPDGRIRLQTSPWQQGWSHSGLMVLLLSLASGLAWGWTAGLIAFGASGVHILMDLLGYSGVGAGFPLTARKTMGFQLLPPHRETFFNGTILWLATLITGWHLFRSLSPVPLVLSPLQLVLFAGVIPLAGLAAMTQRQRA